MGKEAKENVRARVAKMGTCAVGACRLSDDVLISAEHESNASGEDEVSSSFSNNSLHNFLFVFI